MKNLQSSLSSYILREFRLSKKKIVTSLLLAAMIFTGICLICRDNAFVTFEGSKTLVFSFSVAATFIGLFNTLAIFNVEKKHVVPELNGNLYPAFVYLMGNTVIEFLQCEYQTLIACTTLLIFFPSKFWCTGITLPCIIEIYIFMFLTIFSMSFFGLLLSLTINIKAAVIVTPVVLIIQFLLSGGIIPLEGFLEGFSDIIVCKHALMSMGSILDINNYPLEIQNLYPMVEQISDPYFVATQEHILACAKAFGFLTVIPFIISYIILLTYSYCSRE